MRTLPANVTTQSMGYDRKSYSPLRHINKGNVKRLVPIWSTSLIARRTTNQAGTIAEDVVSAVRRSTAIG